MLRRLPASKATCLSATAALLCCTAPGAARAAEAPAGIPLSGRVFTDVYAPAKDLDTGIYRQVSASAWIEGTPKLGEYSLAHFILTADEYEESVAFGQQFTPGLREGYVEYARSGVDLRFGRQIIPWGKSDVINPTDFLSAKDYALFNPDDEVRRIGATSLAASWTPGQGNSPWTLTAVLQPIAPESKLLIAPAEVPAGVAVSAAPVSPPPTLGNTEAAFKAAYNGGRWDASVSAFRGFSHMPQFFLMGLSGAPPAQTATVAQTFYRTSALGGDASLTAGNYVFRAESSYTWTQNDDGLNPLIQPSHWDTVLGGERPFGDDFRLQIQFLYRFYPNFVDPALPLGTSPVAQVNSQIAQENALLLGYQFQSNPGYTARFSYTHDESGIEAEIFFMGNFIGGDYLLKPKFSYAVTDALRATVGLDWYGGPMNRPLGALQVYNSFYAEGKYSF